jgi:hypothetical protein
VVPVRLAFIRDRAAVMLLQLSDKKRDQQKI